MSCRLRGLALTAPIFLMNIVLFEDRQVDQLYPITLARPAYAITCGTLRLLDLAQILARRLRSSLGGEVRPLLHDFQADYFSESPPPTGGTTLWLNARLVPDPNLLGLVETFLASDVPARIDVDGQTAVAVTAEMASAAVLPQLPMVHVDTPPEMLEYPHQVVAFHSPILNAQLQLLLDEYPYRELTAGVYSAGGTHLPSQVAFDSTNGPILLDENVTISPFAYLQGPMRIREHSFVAPHAMLKGPLSIGDHCKIGGEVSKSIMEGYSNKVHFGYLGSSYIGSWVNLGAGTSNSNLKNTYGTVRVEYESGKRDTGMQFLGCIVGDYSKTAIHTAIYTGKIIGVCSNIYGTVTTNVPSFANYARSMGEVTEHSLEVMTITQKRVFSRRGIQQELRHTALLQAMYEIEAPKRNLANQPPSL